ncbi:Uma2 family endonuclease [Roseofilum casamattae]|uniref:Uma2 family endonuclease n=1 Tax=Roseofilum casamattae BLCC-M143 TaxID=3022442 RepID=A0ABT7BZ94_9CYAN|nr:Uma2 family endonuclease [Roseofilum casamattae]MDJ1184529.1 Uma2 family endonuclease [Roseofilum casamattae BLCC-M143]
MGDYLRSLLGNRAKVREVHPIISNNNSEPVPDLAIVKPLGKIYLEHHPYATDIFWIIEFSNTTLTQDLTTKKQLYAASGIPEYWVVNLQENQLHVYTDPKNGDYATETILTAGVRSQFHRSANQNTCQQFIFRHSCVVFRGL